MQSGGFPHKVDNEHEIGYFEQCNDNTCCANCYFSPSRYERNWEAEEKEKRKKRKLKAKAAAVSLCTDSYSSYCDTRAFFLTPVRSKSREKAANKVDFRSICKIL